jgi:hypothetical protein
MAQRDLGLARRNMSRGVRSEQYEACESTHKEALRRNTNVIGGIESCKHAKNDVAPMPMIMSFVTRIISRLMFNKITQHEKSHPTTT